MKALSFQMPWAWFVVNGLKLIENRTWRFSFRGRIYVHCGAKWDNDGHKWIQTHNVATPDQLNAIDEIKRRWGKDLLPGIYGEVEIVSALYYHPSPWFFGPIGYVLANATVYTEPVPCKGQLGFFEVNSGGEVIRDTDDWQD